MGQPRSAISPENTDAVRMLIASDPHATYDEIVASFNISRTHVYYILNDNLKVKRVCSQRIPHILSEVDKYTHVNWSQGKSKEI